MGNVYERVKMIASKDCYAIIKWYEASNDPDLVAYLDKDDGWTIGWGHMGKDVHRDMAITRSKADELLVEDVEWAERCVSKRVDVGLSQGQFDALVDFVYNLGGGTFTEENCTLLRLLNQHNYEGAADEFKRWVYDDGRKLDGLIKRRKTEEVLFRTGKLNLEQ